MANASDVERAEPTLIFLHVHKAGGRTLRPVIGRRYDAARTHVTDDADVDGAIAHFARLPEEERRALRLVQGHMYFGIHEHVPRAATYVTMLRETFDRVVSTYYYLRRQPRAPHHARIVGENLSLEEVVEAGLALTTDNGQTRVLSGQIVPFGQCTREMLERAKRHLDEHFAVVGLVDRFDESLLLMRRAFGWGFPFYVKENVTANRPATGSLTDSERRVIERTNELDLELHAHAVGLFRAQLERAGSTLQTELRIFRMLNPLYNRAYHPARALRDAYRRWAGGSAPSDS